MADNRPLVIDETTGCQEEVVPLTTSSGAADASQLVQTNAAGELDETLFPSSVLNAKTFTAAEALTAGDKVYIDGSGEAARASAASGGNRVSGYVKDSATTGSTVTVFFDGCNDALTGLTVGATYFLSPSTPGGITTTVPTGSGEMVIKVGVATSATQLEFEPEFIATRA